MTRLSLIGVEPGHLYGVRWTFGLRTDDRETRLYARTSLEGLVFDLQTDDGYVGGTGDDQIDDQVTEYIRKVLVLHDAFRALDAARGSAKVCAA